MPFYRYTAIKSEGSRQKGLLEAASFQDAKDRLRAQGVILLKLTQHSPQPLFSNVKKTIKKDLLITLTMQLAELLKAGIPLYECLLSLEEMYRGEPFHYILQSLSEDIKKGLPLSTALAKFSIFNSLYISMVKAGEAIGSLDTALSKLSFLLNKQQKLKKKMTASLIYPTILLCFSCFVVATLLIFVVPSLEALFEDRPLNGFTNAIFSLSHFVTRKYPYYCSCLSLCIPLAFFMYKKKKKQLQEAILRLPIIKKVVIEGAIARFLRTLGSLLEGGVPMKDALAMARGSMGFSLLEYVIEDAEKRIVEGSHLSSELKKSSHFPPLVSRMVAIGEEGGNMTLMLHSAAEFYEDEVEKKLNRLLTLSGPLILLVMGLFVGIIMMAILLPLTDASMFIY